MKFLKTVIQGALFLILLDGISSSSSFSLLGEKNGNLDGKNPVVQPPSNSRPKDQYFEQPLDQFDKVSVNLLWYQRYWSEESHYEKGGPVYLMLADRTVLNKNVMSDGYWFKHGKKKKAMFFYITHRFYDPDVSKGVFETYTRTLNFLNVQQTLADYAAFIKRMNKKYEFPEDTKWIVFGSNYAGNLAAWLRSRYPELVHAAVASSAPVLAKMDIPGMTVDEDLSRLKKMSIVQEGGMVLFSDYDKIIVDYTIAEESIQLFGAKFTTRVNEYLDGVGDALENYSTKCKNDMAEANKDLDEMFESSEGRENINAMFKICEPLNGDKLNISFFAINTVKFISNAIQNDFGYAKAKKICDKMLENVETKTSIERYSTVIQMLMDEEKQKCLSSNFPSHVHSLQMTDAVKAVVSGRLWLHQQCNQFGWFSISRQESGIFSKKINLNYLLNLCSKVFKLRFDEKIVNAKVANTNKSYEGLSLNVDHTLFIHGDADPWKFAQITNNTNNENLDIITIKKGSHCSDIKYADSNEKEMVDAINEIEKKLDSYLEK